MAPFKKNNLRLIFLCLFGLSMPLKGSAGEPWLGRQEQEQMATYASYFEGAPYSFGARQPSSEDCSSLIRKIFSSVGIDLPRSSREQALDPRFESVARDQLRTGDLVFFQGTYRKGISHVAFMIDSQTMLHASPRDRQVAKSKLRPKHPLWRKIHSVRRWRKVASEEELKPKFSWDEKI